MSEQVPSINPDFQLLPLEGQDIDADFELSLPPIDNEFGAPVEDAPDVPPEPFGRSWQFDFAANRFVLLGSNPAPVDELATLQMQVSSIVRIARFAHPIFSDQIGLDNPYLLIGEVLDAELKSDWRDQITEALQVIERITSIDNFVFREVGDVVYVSFNIEIDNAQTATIQNLPLAF